MKLLSWNVRRLGNPRAVRSLQHVLKVYNPQVVFFMDTKVDKIQMKKIRRNFGFLNGIGVPVNGSKGELCLTWKDSVSLSLKCYSGNHIDVEVEGETNGMHWRLISFYGSLYEKDKAGFWDLLCQLGQIQGLLGLFTAILMRF